MTAYILKQGIKYGDQIIDGELTLLQNLSTITRSVTSGDSPVAIDEDIILLCNTIGGDIIVNLPLVANVPNRRYTIKKTSTANTLTVQPAVGNTINGAINLQFTSVMSIDCVARGTDWIILTNLTVAPVFDLGVMQREAIIVDGLNQDLLPAVEYSEVTINNTASGILGSGTVLGQKKTIAIRAINNPSEYTITPSSLTNGTSIIFDTVGQSVQLVWSGAGWAMTGGSGCVVVP